MHGFLQQSCIRRYYVSMDKALQKAHNINSAAGFFFLLAATIRSAPKMKDNRMKAAVNTEIIIIPICRQQDQKTEEQKCKILICLSNCHKQ